MVSGYKVIDEQRKKIITKKKKLLNKFINNYERLIIFGMKRKTGTVLYIMQQNIHDISVSTITQKNPILETTFGKKNCVYIYWGGKGY